MRNKIIIFIIIVLSIILIPKVYAIGSVTGKELNYFTQTNGINYTGNNTWVSLPLSYGTEYGVYYTTNPVLTSTYGIGFSGNIGQSLLPGHYYSVVYASSKPSEGCGLPNSWSQFKATRNVVSGSTIDYATRYTQNRTTGILEYGESDAFDACINIITFSVSEVANSLVLPFNSSSSGTNTWVFYGFHIDDLGLTSNISQNDLQDVADDITSSIVAQANAINSNINTQSTNIQNKIDAAKNQAHTDAQNMQNTIKDDNVDSPNSSINTIKNNLATNGVITNLVTLPVTLYQSILNSVNSSCSTFSLGSLYGTNLQIPCINVANYIGNTLWGTIDVILSGIFVYSISRKMVKVFNQLSSMKEGDVLDG